MREFLANLKDLWILVLIVSNIGSWVYSFIMRFNEIRHLKIDIDDIKKKLDWLEKETAEQGERIARIEGRLNGR